MILPLAWAGEALDEVGRDERCVYYTAPSAIRVVAECRLDAPRAVVDRIAGCWEAHEAWFPASLVASDVLSRPAPDRWVVRQQQPMPFPFSDRVAVLDVRRSEDGTCATWTWELVADPPEAALAGLVVPAVDAGSWRICEVPGGTEAHYELRYDPRLTTVPEALVRSQTLAAIRHFVPAFREVVSRGERCPG